MLGYPMVWWLAVVMATGAVAVVLLGIGYLLGQRSVTRSVRHLRAEVESRAAGRLVEGGR